MKSVLIDTDILIKIFRDKKDKTGIRKKMWKIYKEYEEIFISSITIFEFFKGEKAIDLDDFIKKRTGLISIIGKFNIKDVEFDRNIAEICANSWQKMLLNGVEFEKGKILDFLIGNTAIFKDCYIWTDNTEDFEKIPNLKFI